jgi:hypothetical protein
MPTTTTYVMTNADDGMAAMGPALWPTSFPSPGILTPNPPAFYCPIKSTYRSGFILEKASAWMRFTGIIIPQNSTINTASLNVYGLANGNGVYTSAGIWVQFLADGRGLYDPVYRPGSPTGNPTVASQVITPAAPIYGVGHTITATGALNSPIQYVLQNVDVKSVVQSLVNSYDYAGGTMVFYCHPGLGAGVPVFAGLGESSTAQPAQLVIDYTLPAPSKATTPGPATGAKDVAADQTLSWVDGGGADSYEVYFGTNPSPSDFKGNQAGVTYDPPSDLDAMKTYYWRIDSKNVGGTTTGDVWTFRTVRASDKTTYRYD